MALQVPPEVARARQQQMMEANQLYSMAFEIYKHYLPYFGNIEVAFKEAIKAARFFREGVKEDMSKPPAEHVPAPPVQGMEDLL